ncbi:MAG TPA: AmmeMemoRadiSam system protein B [Thiobacillaceae bacterium]|nr:AmmeMemoRadiSam system protein B [Thiobacillaceae bacterium]
MAHIRPAAVAGTFYPREPAELRQIVTALLADAPRRGDLRAIKALIAPHAGYVYSGALAASAYAQLAPRRGRIRRVVLLGPAHRVWFRGLALPGVDRFATPLGEIELDRRGMDRLKALPQMTERADAHRLEHSLEVQLPFLQQVLGDFELLPMVAGEATAAEVAEVLEAVWGGDETLIVVSSDLSHFLADAAARAMDGGTVEAILALESHLDHEQACGATPINGLLLAARAHGLRPVLLGACNSSDTAGEPDRVVGYAAFAFEATEETDQLDAEKGDALLGLARSEIASRLGARAAQPGSADWLQAPGASFVTLTRRGELRGCIGTLEPYRPLEQDVRDNAVAAAFRDPRFHPLTRGDFADLRVEVSLLSRAERLDAADEAAAVAALRPHVDGIVLEYGECRSTFLPQVWEQLPDPATFLAQLKRKAGLPADFWADRVRLSRYTVTKWKEQ